MNWQVFSGAVVRQVRSIERVMPCMAVMTLPGRVSDEAKEILLMKFPSCLCSRQLSGRRRRISREGSPYIYIPRLYPSYCSAHREMNSMFCSSSSAALFKLNWREPEHASVQANFLVSTKNAVVHHPQQPSTTSRHLDNELRRERSAMRKAF